MIAADRITIVGTEAWWVFGPDEVVPGVVKMADRPCNHCDGTEWLDVEDINCDCIDGRHTFTLSVPCQNAPVECPVHRGEVCDGTVTYRAAIIEVLPILDAANGYPHPKPERFAWVTDAGVLRVVDSIDKFDTHMGQAPPAATPGQYAVRLKLAKEET